MASEKEDAVMSVEAQPGGPEIDRLLPLDSPPAGPSHPGLHALRRLHAGELAGPARTELDAHVAGCPACRERLEAIRADVADFLRRRPFEAFAAARRPAPRSTIWCDLAGALGFGDGDRTPLRPAARYAFLGLLAAGAATAVALVALPSHTPLPLVAPPAPTTRLKAAVDLSFHVRRGDTVTDGRAGGRYKPGDRIQIRYSTPRHAHLVVVSLDSSGAVTPFYDQAGRSLGIAPGAGRLLDGSVELDDTLGTERVIGCFSERPLDTAAVLTAGRRALAAAQGDPAAVGRLDVPCDQATFVIHKVAAGTAGEEAKD